MSNTAESRNAIDALRQSLPNTWEVRQLATDVPQPLIGIFADNHRIYELALLARRSIEPREALSLEELVNSTSAASGADATIIYAPSISLRTRERLARLGVNYIDAGGSVLLNISEPRPLYIRIDRPPLPQRRSEQRLRSLKGPTSGRVVRFLCENFPPYGVREIARRTEVHAGTISRIVDLLDRNALISRDDVGTIVSIDWESLIRTWSEDTTHNLRSNGYFDPRGIEATAASLRDGSVRYAISGMYAAARIALVTPPVSILCYIDDPTAIARDHRLRRTDKLANVFLLKPADESLYDHRFERDGLWLASPVQVVADVLHQPARDAIVETQHLFSWMREHERTWRS